MIKSIYTRMAGYLTIVLFTLSSCASQQSGMNTQTSGEQATNVPVSAEDRSETDIHALQVLFLGDDGLHQPAVRIRELIPYFASRGINITYTDRQEDLNPERLNDFDVFMFYGNRNYLPADQEQALLSYVRNGGGFVAIHSASASFLNSDAFINLVGGAFNYHGGEVFTTRELEPNHPVFEGVPQIESWDETYVHVAHNPNKTVLSIREEGDHEEPWTWVRNYGDGRVFYTAWGHDERTWTNEGFQKLIERATLWTAGDWALEHDFIPPERTYSEGEMPYYPSGESWGTLGDPITQVQNPFSPQESLEHIMSDPAFRVELFASEPDIVNPIDMAWDERGRLWVIETIDYPNRFEEERSGNDVIKILEDTNGDGRVDDITVFAENLNIPTSIVLSNGGAIVAQAPDFIFLKDTNGDGRADHREVLITGWDTFDTHAGPNNLHYGLDNQIWGAVGYAGMNGTVGGEEFDFAQGLYRFTTDGQSLEFISNTSNNTWGLGFNEEGMIFGSTANGRPVNYSAVPNRFFQSIGESNPVLHDIASTNLYYPLPGEVRAVDWHGRFTSAAGFHVYTARDFPKAYWNRKAFVTDPTGHLIAQFDLETNGSDYAAKNEWNLLASLDEWFSPIQTKVGPDGALWFLDWYNLIIQHNPTPSGWEQGEGNAYVNELRDQDHARIYRVVYNGAEERPVMNLENATSEQLLEALSHDNMFWRLTAQRLLVERGDVDVLPNLYELVRDDNTDDLGLNPGSLHALWTIHGLGALDGSNQEALETGLGALYHYASSVRRAALMALPRNERVRDEILNAGFLPNPDVRGGVGYRAMSGDPQIRLAALLALAEMPVSETAGRTVAETMLRQPNLNDRWIRDAGVAAGVRHMDGFLTRIGERDLPGDEGSTVREHVESVIERVSQNQ